MILIGLGANLPTVFGEPLSTLNSALRLMPDYGIKVVRCSSFYRTPAMARDVQPPYINAVAVVESAMPAKELLAALHRIEAQFGRVRRLRWAPRTLDLDLLDYEGQIVTDAGPRGQEAGVGPLPLALPHPGVSDRGFVLIPLMEVAPYWRHPVSGENALELLKALMATGGGDALAAISQI